MTAVPRLAELPTSVSLRELLDALGHLETTQLDFKRKPAKLAELMAAFAMTDGGLIVLGIEDDRSLCGCSLSQSVQDAITRTSHDVGVDVQYREIEVDESTVVVVAVPEIRRRIVTTPDGRLLRRVGSANEPVTGDRLARFVRDREDLPGEDVAVPNPNLEDFDLSLVNAALSSDSREPVDASGLVRALIDLDVAKQQPPPADPQILVAAVLLYSKRPNNVVAGATLQIVRRLGVGPGTGPVEAREDLEGPIALLLEKSIEFIEKHTRKYQVVLGTRRQTWNEYPSEVLREAILNALAHRDYNISGSTIDITVWDDRIEIRSPGGLPGPITMDNIRVEHYSRNRKVMRNLKMLNLVEEYGEGIDRMFDFMEARAMEPPLIAPTPSSVSITLKNRFLISIEEQAWLATLGHMVLTTDERRALAIARREGAVTRRRLRQILTEGQIDSVLRGAVTKGLLLKTGAAGGVKYVLSDEVLVRAGSSGVEAQARKRQILLDEVLARGSISTAEGAELLGEDSTVARHLLNDLAATGDVVARGQTRARRYYRSRSTSV